MLPFLLLGSVGVIVAFSIPLYWLLRFQIDKFQMEDSVRDEAAREVLAKFEFWWIGKFWSANIIANKIKPITH